ncbi:hypothetical protein V1460_05010 [Streptomyces sp. SCSIO 30461]
MRLTRRVLPTVTALVTRSGRRGGTAAVAVTYTGTLTHSVA